MIFDTVKRNGSYAVPYCLLYFRPKVIMLPMERNVGWP